MYLPITGKGKMKMENKQLTWAWAACVTEAMGNHWPVKYWIPGNSTRAILLPSRSMVSRMSDSLRVYSPCLGAIWMMAFEGSKPWAWTCEANAYYYRKKKEGAVGQLIRYALLVRYVKNKWTTQTWSDGKALASHRILYFWGVGL